MHFWFYENSRQFLERMIQEHPENQGLISAYTSLISKVAEIEIEYSAHNTEYNKNHDTNQAELAKTQQSAHADITKVQIEKGFAPPQFAPLSHY